MSKTKKIISLLLVVALVMTMATVAIVSASAASTVYFENSAGWGAINVYYWGGSDTPGWPGVPCTDLGNNIWSASVPDDCTNIIFNDGSNQTSDLTFPGDGFIAKLDGGMGGTEYGEKPSATWEAYNNSDDVITTTAGGNDDNTDFVVDGDGATVYFSNGNYWETVYIHYWDADGNGTDWPGVPMNYVFTNEYSQDVYNYTVPAGTAGIIFTAGQDGPQTMDIKEGIVDNAGFYIDMSSTQNDQGHWAYGTWTYTPTGEETTAKPVETTAEETTATPVVDNGVSVDGTLYDVAVGDTITYTYDLTAARLFENIQATVYYDSAKLELVRYTSDDPDVEDWEVEGPIACPNLDGVIFNAGVDGLVKLNASKVAGYNFKDTKTLVTLQFKVKDASYSEIYTVIEEMTIKGGEESYFTGGQQVITEGITLNDYLGNVDPITTASQATE
ncbi:MAG: starch-binding protein, partial [Clostridia bacterium]|nr:starch-binding protein [Clostridia bacterium]